VFVRDPRAERALPHELIERLGVGAIVAVPLSEADRCLGFLVLDCGGRDFELEEQDLQLLTATGYLAAVLIEKADQFTELERVTAELRRIDEAKSQFVSIASHELRTPIAVVHGIASTLQLRAQSLSPEQLVELRTTLFGHTTRLAELAEQLLDLSRLDADAMTLEPVRFRPRERIDELLPRVVPDRIDEIELKVDPALEVVTDPHGFERVVANLIINAFRYGLPPVEVRAETRGPFRLVVADRGRGVDPAFVPRLFERFSRSTASDNQAGGGAGLGLSIARSFARALGGDLSYEAGRPGARFTLELPAEVLAA
jgi:signal transduction histidine kinase